MSLKTDYWDGVAGLNTKQDDSFDLGVAFIVSLLATLTLDLQTQAALGKRNFTLSYPTTDNVTNMMSNQAENLIAQSYLAGIAQALADEDIYNYEVVPALYGTTASASVQLFFTL